MSGVDTSIYQNLLRPPKSVAEYDAEALSNQQNRLALQMSQAQLTDRQRAIDDGNKLRQVVSGFGADKTANSNALQQGGFLKEAQAYDKGNADVAKTNADVAHLGAQTQETHFKAVNLKLGQVKDLANTMSTPAQAALLVQGMYKDPDLAQVFAASGDTPEAAVARIPTDPAGFQKWKMQFSLGADKLIEYTTPNANTVANNETSRLNTKDNNDRIASEGAANRGVTIRGQDLTEKRAKETAAAGKVPSGYRLGKDGVSLEAIPGGPADPQNKPLTETQGKASLFATRMDKADKIMTDIIASGTKTPAMLAGLPGGNFTANVNQQKLEQAQRDFLNAVLRQESGAVIGPTEFESGQKQYFPQRGDAPEVILQKAENRRTAIQGMGVMAGPGMGKMPPSPATAPSTPVKNAKGWALHTDANGNKAYVSPDGKQFQEVQ